MALTYSISFSEILNLTKTFGETVAVPRYSKELMCAMGVMAMISAVK